MIFPPVFNVTAHLNGINAFEIVGMPDTWFGYSVDSVGDINGDGIADLIIGAPADTSTTTGITYVIFGAATFPATFNLDSLNGANGFQIIGPDASNFGLSVSGAGDINGDGIQDLIVGEPYADSSAGAVYIIFGARTFQAEFNVALLNGTNGFKVVGSDSPRTGYSVSSTGDINGDGREDFIVGTMNNQAFVIFGAPSFPAVLYTASLNGINGFKIQGPYNTATGSVVAGIGDINGDGKQDMLAGGWLGSVSYVIFGAANFSATVNVPFSNSSNGFEIIGPLNSLLGWAGAGVGDINGDGRQDFVVGTYGHPVAQDKAFVIFGAANFSATLDTASINGTNGFCIIGPAGSALGSAISAAGDMNNDGRPDMIVGADALSYAFVIFGAAMMSPAYVFGAANFSVVTSAVLDTDSLNGPNGFQIIGPSRSIFANSVSGAGDINGDGRPDLIVGAYGANKVFVVLNPTGLTPAQVPAAIPEVVPALLPSQVPAVSPAQVPDLSPVQLPLLPPPPEMPPVIAPHSVYNEGLVLGLSIGLGGATGIALTVAGIAIYAGMKGLWCFGRERPAGSVELTGVAASDGEVGGI